MHLQWLSGGRAGDFLAWLRELGVTVLEFALAISSPDWTETNSLIEECQQRGFRLSFHAPSKAPYNPAGFSGERRSEVERLYRPALAYATRFSKGDAPITLVVHGAKGYRPRAELRRDTMAFLNWIADEFASLHPALELLARDKRKGAGHRRAGKNKIGDNKVELVDIVSSLHRQVGVCWDLGHDTRNGSLPVPPGFIGLVKHVHLHDVSPDGKDHHPLVFGNVPYKERLGSLMEAGYTGAVILEVDGRLVARFAAARGVPPLQVLAASLTRIGRLIASQTSERVGQ